MKRSFVIGALTLWITIYLVFFMLWGVGYISFPNTEFIIILHLFSFIVSLYLIIAYLKAINLNSHLTKNSKGLWVISILLFSPLSMIAYFLIHRKNFDASK